MRLEFWTTCRICIVFLLTAALFQKVEASARASSHSAEAMVDEDDALPTSWPTSTNSWENIYGGSEISSWTPVFLGGTHQVTFALGVQDDKTICGICRNVHSGSGGRRSESQEGVERKVAHQPTKISQHRHPLIEIEAEAAAGEGGVTGAAATSVRVANLSAPANFILNTNCGFANEMPALHGTTHAVYDTETDRLYIAEGAARKITGDNHHAEGRKVWLMESLLASIEAQANSPGEVKLNGTLLPDTNEKRVGAALVLMGRTAAGFSHLTLVGGEGSKGQVEMLDITNSKAHWEVVKTTSKSALPDDHVTAVRHSTDELIVTKQNIVPTSGGYTDSVFRLKFTPQEGRSDESTSFSSYSISIMNNINTLLSGPVASVHNGTLVSVLGVTALVGTSDLPALPMNAYLFNPLHLEFVAPSVYTTPTHTTPRDYWNWPVSGTSALLALPGGRFLFPLKAGWFYSELSRGAVVGGAAGAGAFSLFPSYTEAGFMTSGPNVPPPLVHTASDAPPAAQEGGEAINNFTSTVTVFYATEINTELAKGDGATFYVSSSIHCNNLAGSGSKVVPLSSVVPPTGGGESSGNHSVVLEFDLGAASGTERTLYVCLGKPYVTEESCSGTVPNWNFYSALTAMYGRCTCLAEPSTTTATCSDVSHPTVTPGGELFADVYSGMAIWELSGLPLPPTPSPPPTPVPPTPHPPTPSPPTTAIPPTPKPLTPAPITPLPPTPAPGTPSPVTPQPPTPVPPSPAPPTPRPSTVVPPTPVPTPGPTTAIPSTPTPTATTTAAPPTPHPTTASPPTPVPPTPHPPTPLPPTPRPVTSHPPTPLPPTPHPTTATSSVASASTSSSSGNLNHKKTAAPGPTQHDTPSVSSGGGGGGNSGKDDGGFLDWLRDHMLLAGIVGLGVVIFMCLLVVCCCVGGKKNKKKNKKKKSKGDDSENEDEDDDEDDDPDSYSAMLLDRKYRLDRVLGKGGYGVVFQGRKRRANNTLLAGQKKKPPMEQVAIKFIACRDQVALDTALLEAEMLSKFKHPNKMPILDTFMNWEEQVAEADIKLQQSPKLVATKFAEKQNDGGRNKLGAGGRITRKGEGNNNGDYDDDFDGQDSHAKILHQLGKRFVCIVTPYYSEGDLRQSIISQRSLDEYFSEEYVVSISLQIAELLKYLHGIVPNPVVHRDLKPENILLSNNRRTAVVTDFGLAKQVEHTMTTQAGSLPFVAPECWNRRYSVAVDIWSLGCLIYAMCTQRVQVRDIRIMFNECKRPDFTDMIREDTAYYSTELQLILVEMLIVDPKKRMRAETAVDKLSKLKRYWEERKRRRETPAAGPFSSNSSTNITSSSGGGGGGGTGSNSQPYFGLGGQQPAPTGTGPRLSRR